MREQRKLAAVLAADVVGYSRLMGRDEAGTLARLKEHRSQRLEPALQRNGGRLVKLTGDGALAEFGSAVDGLRAAIEFQQAVDQANAALPEEQRIIFRIGLHVGDLIVDGDDLYGDGVNIAARLEAEAPAGGIVVSGALHEATAGKLQVEFVDLGRLSLKNIDRQVQAYRIEFGQDRQPKATPPAGTGAPLPLPDKPSIAVMPFQNMSGDPEQAYFADGVVEDIITALSRFRSLFVIARNSSFTYKGRAVDIKQVGRELGVRYVLEGSVRKAGGRVRVTGQLIDSETGAHLWADRFDGDAQDVFDLQDEVVGKVVGAIAPGVEQAEIERAQRKPTANLGAHECYLRTLPFWWANDRDRNDEAARLLRRALEIDPGHTSAMGLLLAVYANRRAAGFHGDGVVQDGEVEAMVRKVVAAGRDDAVALGFASYAIAYLLRDLAFAEEQVARALTLNSNLASAWVFSGYIRLWSGDPLRTVSDVDRASRLDPLNDSPSWKSATAHAYYFHDRHEECLRIAESMRQRNPTAHTPLRLGAVSAAFAGRMEVAQAFASDLQRIDPAFRISRLATYLGPYRSAAFLEKYQEGLRRAGLPE
jgi:adenylate cyclase